MKAKCSITAEQHRVLLTYFVQDHRRNIVGARVMLDDTDVVAVPVSKLRDHLDLPLGVVPAYKDRYVSVLARVRVRHERESVGTSEGS